MSTTIVTPETHPDIRNAEDFLAWVETQEGRHEFIDGRIVAMTGGTRRHGMVGGNLLVALTNKLRASPCWPYNGDVGVVMNGNVFYPDVSVSCSDESNDALRHPVVVAEVLSPSSLNHDRGLKLKAYRQLSSLRHYLILSQEFPEVEHYSRAEETPFWRYTVHAGPDAEIDLAAIGVALRLGDLYERVAFESEDG